MDKTVEVIVVLMILMIVAVIVVSLVTDQTDFFNGFSDDQTSNAQCSLWETQYQNQYCGDDAPSGSGSDLEQKLGDCSDHSASC